MIDDQIKLKYQMKLEHLKLVQNVIVRMAGNSAQLKAWAVPLVAATFFFLRVSDDPYWLISLGGCIMIIILWGMDAEYLRLERCYRKLYEAIVADKSEIKLFVLDYRRYVAAVDPVWKVAMSWSVWRFYGALLLLMLFPLVI